MAAFLPRSIYIFTRYVSLKLGFLQFGATKRQNEFKDLIGISETRLKRHLRAHANPLGLELLDQGYSLDKTAEAIGDFKTKELVERVLNLANELTVQRLPSDDPSPNGLGSSSELLPDTEKMLLA
jgi:hypothetical protein